MLQENSYIPNRQEAKFNILYDRQQQSNFMKTTFVSQMQNVRDRYHYRSNILNIFHFRMQRHL